MPSSPRVHKPWKGKPPRHMVVTNRQQTRAMHTGSKAWRLLRERVLADQQHRCAECGQYGDQVDHIDGDSHNNAMENLQVLCLRHHSAKTMRELNRARR